MNIVKEQQKIDDQARVVAKSINEEAIFDGIISPENYQNSKCKIVWLLREPHDGGSWDYKPALVERSKREPHNQGFWDKIRKVHYSVNHDFIKFSEIPESKDNAEVHKAFLEACFINLNKIGGGATIEHDYKTKVDLFHDVILKQLKLADPDVIICAGTYGYTKDWINEFQGNKLVIKSYHLSQRTVKTEVLLNDIIMQIEKYTKK